jgi:2,4-dichlorophenol 6-monooxygenase
MNDDRAPTSSWCCRWTRRSAAGRKYDDLYGEWAQVRGIYDGGVLLARPDNYVAFRQVGAASDDEAEGALESALLTVLDRA